MLISTPLPAADPTSPEQGHAVRPSPGGSRLRPGVPVNQGKAGTARTGTQGTPLQGTRPHGLQRRRHLVVPNLNSLPRPAARSRSLEDDDGEGDKRLTTPQRIIASLPHSHSNGQVHASPRFSAAAHNFPFAFLMSAPVTPITARSGSGPAYPPPPLAHKSAHYLHSIPPREKTTRTLILDHVLWKHGKARFAQARAELGLRILKEDEEEEGDDEVDGADDVDALQYRPSASGRPPLVLGPGDPGKAKAYKASADGHENVLSAMLEQPPDVPYGSTTTANGYDDSDPASKPPGPVLPNGVRLRLTLTSLVNDFFARDEDPVILSRGAYPPSIVQLQLISNPCAPASSLPTLPSLADLLNSSPGPSAPAPTPASAGQGGAKPTSIWAAVPRGLGMDAPWAFAGTLQAPPPPAAPSGSGTGTSTAHGPQPPPADWPKLNAPASSSPAARAIALYNAGALAPLNPIQCSRHLTPCNCLSGPSAGNHASRHIGAGLRRPSLLLLRRRSNLLSSGLGGDRSLPTSRLTDLLPRFIRLSALVAIELGREAVLAADESTRPSTTNVSIAGDTTDSSAASPYASEGETESDHTPLPARPSRAWYALLCTLCTRACLEGYLARGWRGTEGVETLFGVGVDLGMTLDGLMDDDAATAAAGAGSDESMTDAEDGAELEPDGWPSMEEAARVLFSGAGQGEEGYVPLTTGAQAEYEQEMRARRDLFLNIPPNTNDLRSHLMDLAGRYPPEPMERAALKFCEAVSRWRGKPELQGNPQKNRIRSMSIASSTASQSASALSITSLIHPPSPTRGSLRPPIDRWFLTPSRAERRRPLSVRAALGTGKRKRERDLSGDARKGKGKKVDRTDSKGYVEEDDWVDPYGIPG
ncbi:hypothetical protein CALVIDRAFT_560382 [Calocera viscosa TUFC12733]|uniref:Uncharacterized protein n=1 Tax=Calocera viscosa (strain TUFC12733) TaxID=1330018 RepID=A0A167QZ97_CALVF|nr:hypothetical protein CALVIDRAFT_560382 [Calocera viscosa TUFC12733]